MLTSNLKLVFISIFLGSLTSISFASYQSYDSTDVKLAPSVPKKYCCITYLGNSNQPTVVTNLTMNSYSTKDKLYNCPPGYVATSVRLEPKSKVEVYGVYCYQIINKCEWVDYDQPTLTVPILFWYYQPAPKNYWSFEVYNYTGTCN